MKKFVSRVTGIALAFGALGSSAAFAMVQDGPKQIRSQLPEAIPGEFVVQFKSGVMTTQGFVNALSSMGMQVQETIHSGLVRVAITDKKLFAKTAGLTTMSEASIRNLAVNKLSSLSGVKFAEPNFIYRAAVLADNPVNTPPNDTTSPAEVIPADADFAKLWGMKNTGQADSTNRKGKVGTDISATKAWAVTTGNKDVIVAVIDTGVDYTHKVLAPNIWSAPDGSHGFNAITGVLDPKDDHSHGSHCSGTIGGTGQGSGVYGVTQNVRIMGVKFLDSQGSGSLADAVKAIDWATEHGSKIQSNSWGGGGFSDAMKDSIKRACDKGVLFVAAAGNESNDNDASPSYPASYDLPCVVSVAAMNNVEELSYFSNFGKKSVHLAAPGENIYSTVAGGGFDTYSGTSMATPHVSGAAALLWGHEPSLTNIQVKERLMATTDKVKVYQGKTASGGRLNIYNALMNIVPPGPVPVPGDSWKTAPAAISSAHPYLINTKASWTIEQPGATHLNIHFKTFATEAGYDFVKITTDKGDSVSFSGKLGDHWSGDLEGSKATIDFTSDDTEVDPGFDIDSYQWSNFVQPNP